MGKCNFVIEKAGQLIGASILAPPIVTDLVTNILSDPICNGINEMFRVPEMNNIEYSRTPTFGSRYSCPSTEKELRELADELALRKETVLESW